MSKNRWEEVSSALAFWEGDIEVTHQKDRIRKLFQLRNENMNQRFKAGDIVVCDESMCRWLAKTIMALR